MTDQEMQTAPYGTWPSTLTPEVVSSGSLRCAEPQLCQGRLFWLESRPDEKGRNAVVMRTPDGKLKDLLPSPWSARSGVHEYGGGAYRVEGNSLYFVEASDQQVYAVEIDSEAIRQPYPLTGTPDIRYGNLTWDPARKQLLAVAEDHSPEIEPTNSLVCLDVHNAGLPPKTLASGEDFYASPCASPCGRWLVFLSWRHPNMPWDSTTLWLQPMAADGPQGKPVPLVKRPGQSIFQPRWAPDGSLFWVSDFSNWWNLYRLPVAAIMDAQQGQDITTQIQPVCPKEAEFGLPLWSLGMSTYDFLNAHTALTIYSQQGSWFAALLQQSPAPGMPWRLLPLELEFNHLAGVVCEQGKAAFVAGSSTRPDGIYWWDGERAHPCTEAPAYLPAEDISQAQSIALPAQDGDGEVHAFFYTPCNSRWRAPDNTLPPVIVLGHGGPTGATEAACNYKIQFWTHRGFAVLDVNYRGSTGFGRKYRRALRGKWGVRDVQDLVAAVDYVCQQGWVHPQQKIIRGSSAGGFTVLAALTDSDRFDAGVSLYGIGDLEALIADTHKFEARYLDSLVGPYPECKDLYQERSPIHKVDQIACPLLVFQGLKDRVVPPNQAETMVEAVHSRGLPVAYVTYPDEAHGFRQAATIDHQLRAEWYFYRKVFGLEELETDGEPAPLTIMNAQQLSGRTSGSNR